MALLRVTDLACARGGIPVLRGVSFDLDAGEALLLRGPNGIGKTTLLRCIAGLQPPLEGGVTGEDIAYGAHADGLKATLSVAENLEFWAGIYGTSGIDAALQAFDIADLRDRLAQNLSAGQKRRTNHGVREQPLHMRCATHSTAIDLWQRKVGVIGGDHRVRCAAYTDTTTQHVVVWSTHHRHFA